MMSLWVDLVYTLWVCIDTCGATRCCTVNTSKTTATTTATERTAATTVFGLRGLHHVWSPAGCLCSAVFKRVLLECSRNLAASPCPHGSKSNPTARGRRSAGRRDRERRTQSCGTTSGTNRKARKAETPRVGLAPSVVRTRNWDTRQRQVPGHRWKVPPCAVCSGNAAGTGDGEAGRNTVRGSDGHHLQSGGRDQSETGRAAQRATCGQTTGRCEDSAHAGCCTLHQEEAGAGGDRDKGGPGEGDVASGVHGVPEVRAVGPTRPERPCRSYLRRTGQRGRQQEQLLRWM